MTETKVSSDFIRTLFARAMSAMYREEVPAYGTLIDLVSRVNEATLRHLPSRWRERK